MKIGMVAPQFVPSPQPALSFAEAAEQHGIDGVFVFDHLWSLDKPAWTPSQSAIPLVSALAAHTRTLTIGTLVARVGIEDNELLYRQIMTVFEIASGRFVAALGIGDKLSLRENEAYGVPFAPRARRLELLGTLAGRLSKSGVDVWLGGRSADVRALATENGVLVNQWQVEPEEMEPTDTWGGVYREASDVRNLAQHGVEWSVFLMPGSARDPEGAVQQMKAALTE